MATVVAHTVNPAGTGDYTSLVAWVASISARGTDLVSREVIEQARCTGSVGRLSIGPMTTSSSCYAHVVADTGQAHAGVWDGAKANIAPVYASGYNTVSPAYTLIEDMQVTFTFGANSGKVFACNNIITLLKCIIKPTSLGSYTSCKGIDQEANYPCHLIDCLIYGFNTTGSYGYFSDNYGSATAYVYNSTIVNCTYGFKRGSGCPVLVKNCLAQGCTDGFVGTFATGSTNNCSDVTSDAPGTSAVTGSVAFVDSANANYHLSSSDTVAKGAGTNLSADSGYAFSTDIDGDTITTWSIGADAQVATSGGGSSASGAAAASSVASSAATGAKATTGASSVSDHASSTATGAKSTTGNASATSTGATATTGAKVAIGVAYATAIAAAAAAGETMDGAIAVSHASASCSGQKVAEGSASAYAKAHCTARSSDTTSDFLIPFALLDISLEDVTLNAPAIQ